MKFLNDEAVNAAVRKFRSAGDFVPCEIEGDAAYARACGDGSFQVICPTYGTRPDKTRSWQRLEDAGASLHADTDAAGQGLYLAVAGEDEFVGHLVRSGAVRTDVPRADGQEAASRMWRAYSARIAGNAPETPQDRAQA